MRTNRVADRREFLRRTSAAGLAYLGVLAPAAVVGTARAAGDHRLRAGTAQVEITPQKFPVLVCGGFLSQSATQVHDPLFARCLALDDGAQRVVLMVVDTIDIPYAMQEIGPCGPSDPQVSVLAVQSPDGRPIALLANYSMHYFGASPISADYYGDFARIVSQRLAAGDDSFVAMMSHGTSGDQQWQDYANPPRSVSRLQYATGVAEAALRAYQRIEFHETVPLLMAERRLTIKLVQPDAAARAWAQETFTAMADREPRTRTEVYAREIVQLQEMPEAERKLQVLRLGDLGIAALPAEVYAITGLKLKRQCPLRQMFNIELANGSIGYIPPPELRPLGGYNTWPARHTATQNDIEPIMVNALLEMFEEVTGQPRRPLVLSQGPAATQIVARQPVAYWRLGEIEGHRAWDASGQGHHGTYEPGYALYLDGPDRDDLRSGGEQPRAVQFVGGRMKAQLDLGRDYTVELWFWNGLPNDNRSVTGYLFSLGPDADQRCPGEHLGISGTAEGRDAAGRLFFFNGDERREFLAGSPVIAPQTWHHLRLVRRGEQVAIYLDGGAQPILSGQVSVTRPAGNRDVFIGGRSDNFANFEGRLAEVAIFAA